MSIQEKTQALLDRAPKLCSSDVAIIMRETYETCYGIHNHDERLDEKPLDLVAKRWQEDSSTDSRFSLLYERIQQFVDLNVCKFTGLSLDKFMEMPSEYCKTILEICADKSRNEDNIARDLTDELKRNLGKPTE